MNIYTEEIIDHYKNPSHFGKPGKYTSESKQLNPYCGDEVEIFVNLKNSKILDIGFTGHGCAISMAATSMLMDYAQSKSKNVLTKFSDEDMLEMLGVEVSDSRKKCALLGLATLKDTIK